jgi:hypothetical protein
MAEKSRVKDAIEMLGAEPEVEPAVVELDGAAVVALVALDVLVELLVQAPATRPAPTNSAANARL